MYIYKTIPYLTFALNYKKSSNENTLRVILSFFECHENTHGVALLLFEQMGNGEKCICSTLPITAL